MSSTSLLVIALLVAVVSVPTIGGMTAWGLAGGDGEPDNAFMGLLAAMVGFGSVYNVIASYLAFFDIATWQWWLMWVAPAGGVLGLAVAARDRSSNDTAVDWAVGVGMQLGLAVPAVLVWQAV